jgi:hypothetical protein
MSAPALDIGPVEIGLKEMTGAHRRQSNWIAEEDRRLLEFVEAGKSGVFISANLKRPANRARNRRAFLVRGNKADFDSGPESKL